AFDDMSETLALAQKLLVKIEPPVAQRLCHELLVRARLEGLGQAKADIERAARGQMRLRRCRFETGGELVIVRGARLQIGDEIRPPGFGDPAVEYFGIDRCRRLALADGE